MQEKKDPIPQERENLTSLLAKYLRADLIPNAELNAIGYTRTVDGTISKTEAIAIRQQADAVKAEKNRIALEKKITSAPFAEIPVCLKSAHSYRRIDNRTEFKALDKRLQNIFDFDSLRIQYIEVLSATDPDIDQLFNIFLDLSEQHSIIEFTNWFVDPACYMFGDDVLSREEGQRISDLYWRNTGIDQLAFLTSMQSQEIFMALERLKSRLNDADEIERKKNEYKIETLESRAKIEHIDEEVLVNTSRFLGIELNHDTLMIECMVRVVQLLAREQLPSLINQNLDAIKDPVRLQAKLRALEKDMSWSEEFNRWQALKSSLKSASIEQKRAQSMELQSLRKAVDSQQCMLRGLAKLLDLYSVFAHALNQEINKVQRHLVRSAKDQEIDAEFFLDGRPNEVLDKDPGEMSGDCTKGKPLPFAESDIPLYNIKILDNQRNHVGNAYLLVAHSLAGKKVWYLDATQIPGNLDWAQSATLFRDALADAAKQKGIDFITINKGSQHVSNYDYVADALLQLTQEFGGATITIEKPSVDTRQYSDFQGDDEVLVIWKNTDIVPD